MLILDSILAANASHPDTAPLCPTIEGFLRQLSKTTDAAGRDRLTAWVLERLDRLAATLNDGHAQTRKRLAADYAIRTVLASWLALAATGRAATLRGLLPITDTATVMAANDAVARARDEIPTWSHTRRRLSAAAFTAVNEHLADEPAADPNAIADAASDADVIVAAVVSAATYTFFTLTQSTASDAYLAAAFDADVILTHAVQFEASAAASVAATAATTVAATLGPVTPGDRTTIYDAVKDRLVQEINQALVYLRTEDRVRPAADTAIAVLELMLTVGQADQAADAD